MELPKRTALKNWTDEDVFCFLRAFHLSNRSIDRAREILLVEHPGAHSYANDAIKHFLYSDVGKLWQREARRRIREDVYDEPYVHRGDRIVTLARNLQRLVDRWTDDLSVLDMTRLAAEIRAHLTQIANETAPLEEGQDGQSPVEGFMRWFMKLPPDQQRLVQGDPQDSSTSSRFERFVPAEALSSKPS